MQQFLKAIVARVYKAWSEQTGCSAGRSWPMENERVAVVITRWRDEEALKAWAGPLWRRRPVLIDSDMTDYLAHSSKVSLFTPLDAETILSS